MNDIADHIDNPHECKHNWQPLSFVFETQLLDSEGRVNIRQPGIDHGRVYLVCLRCCLHTYMVTQWAGFQLEGPPTTAPAGITRPAAVSTPTGRTTPLDNVTTEAKPHDH